MKPETINIDFETYSEVDLLKVGSWVYSQHPSTEILWLAVTYGSNEPRLYDDIDVIHHEISKILKRLKEGYIASGWNIAFETDIIANTLDFGVEAIDYNQWEDSMAMAAAMALPHSLAQCGVALNAPEDFMKMTEGKGLIKQLSVPQKCTENQWIKERMFCDHYEFIRNDVTDKGSPVVFYRDTDPVAMEEFGEYCGMDTVSERWIKSQLRPLSEIERQIWVQTMELNQKGIPIDLHLCKSAMQMYQKQKAIELEELGEQTQLENPNSRDQIKGWLSDNGVDTPNLKKETVLELLKADHIPEDIKRVLKLRQSSAKTPPTKYAAITVRTDKQDRRYRGAHFYHGATTGRETSRGMNWQNPYRPTFDDIPGACQWIKENRTEDLDLVYGGVIEALSSCIRGAVVPSKGCELVDVDYSSIEGRKLAWLAGEERKLEIYRTTGLAYESTASAIYKVKMENVTGQQRFVGKTAELACGFQGGFMSLIGMAARYGVDFESYKPEGWKIPRGWFDGWWASNQYKDESDVPFAVWFAQDVVTKWRKVSPKTVALWYAMEENAIEAIENPGTVQRVNDKLAFRVARIGRLNYLFMQLPSGRLLSYPDVHLGKGKFGIRIQYRGINSTTKQWATMHTYGGDLTQSATQASARDVLLQAVLRAKGTKYGDIILKVHDQAVANVPIGTGSVDEFGALLCEEQEWFKGLPLDYDGMIRTRFGK